MSRYLILMLIVMTLMSCSSGAKRMDANEDIVADSGGITRQELDRAAGAMAARIGKYFEENPRTEGILVAFLPTKNETSEMIPTDYFDNRFVSELIKQKIYTVKRNTRQDAMKEIALSHSGMTANQLSIGNMRVPNFFIQSRIDENMYMHDGDRIMEQTINVELIDVESQIAIWNQRVVYRKQAANRRRGAEW